MRVLVDGMVTVIGGKVIGSELLDGLADKCDLEAAYIAQCDNGAYYLVQAG